MQIYEGTRDKTGEGCKDVTYVCFSKIFLKGVFFPFIHELFSLISISTLLFHPWRKYKSKKILCLSTLRNSILTLSPSHSSIFPAVCVLVDPSLLGKLETLEHSEHTKLKMAQENYSEAVRENDDFFLEILFQILSLFAFEIGR